MTRTRRIAGAVTMGAAALLALPALASADPSTNLITNGGFEQPALSSGPGYQTFGPTTDPGIPGWQVTNGTVDVVANTFFQAAEGSQSLDLDGTPGPGAIAQSIATTPGQTYTLTFELAGNHGDQAVKSLNVTAGDSSHDYTFDTSGTTNSDMGYVPESQTFTANDTSTLITFTSTDPAGNAGPVIDAVSVTESPTAALPESPLAVGLPLVGIAVAGGAAVVLRRRRRA